MSVFGWYILGYLCVNVFAKVLTVCVWVRERILYKPFILFMILTSVLVLNIKINN